MLILSKARLSPPLLQPMVKRENLSSDMKRFTHVVLGRMKPGDNKHTVLKLANRIIASEKLLIPEDALYSLKYSVC